MNIITIISCITSTLGVGAIISGVVSRKLSKAEQNADEKEKARTEEIVLILSGIKATGALSYATAMALKRGHANGEVEKGIESYTAWEKELDTFMMEQTARK